ASALVWSSRAAAVAYFPPRITDVCRNRMEYACARTLAVTSSPSPRTAQVSGGRVRKPDDPRPKEKMKVRMMAPKMSAIRDDLAFDRITSSIGQRLRLLVAGGRKNHRPHGCLESLTP